MTLFRQFALMLFTLISAMLFVVSLLNFASARDSAKDRLYDDAKNSATTLSLSLGSVKGDVGAMSVMINANFDSGNYELIRLVDVDGKILSQKLDESKDSSTPLWFSSLVDIKAPHAFANVSSGWIQVGILEVVSNASSIEQELYKNFKEITLFFALTLSLSLALLYATLKFMLRPMDTIKEQVKGVLENKFILQKDLPKTLELRDIVISINTMVFRLKAIFEQSAMELKELKEREYVDKDTGLKNKTYFISKLPQYLKDDASSSLGSNIFMDLRGVIDANNKLGRVAVNGLISKLIESFKKHSSHLLDSMIIRVSGVEFSIFLPRIEMQEAEDIAKKIQKESFEIIKSFDLEERDFYLSFGIYEYASCNSVSEFLSACDDSLSQAHFFDSKIYAQRASQTVEIMGKNEWRQTIVDSIESDRFKFSFWNVVDLSTKKIKHKIITTKLSIDEEKSFSYAQFMSHALQLGLAYELYTHLLIKLFKSKLDSEWEYAFRLPYEFISSRSSYEFLLDLLSSGVDKKITFELPDRYLRGDSKYITKTVDLLHAHGVGVGVYEFIADSDGFEYLHAHSLSYIKMDPHFILSQQRASLSALKSLTRSLGIDIIAFSVNSDKLRLELEALGIENIQGVVTEKLI
ncbi:MAG: LapD/MoxY N-terminal periplasmic domain-containing protein [Sulfuricurvum sp.]